MGRPADIAITKASVTVSPAKTQCEKRHSRKCRFRLNYGHCKFGLYCSFKHGNEEDENEVVKLRNDYEKLRSSFEKMKSEIEVLKTKFTQIEETTSHSEVYKQKYDLNTSVNASSLNASSLEASPGLIPQLDGLRDDSDSVLIQCEDCKLTFLSQKELSSHVERVEYAREECAICFCRKLIMTSISILFTPRNILSTTS